MTEFYTDLFYSTFQVRKVKVSFSPNTFTQLKVVWDSVPLAISYNVYGSPSPFTKNKLNTTPITNTFFTYDAPQVPEDVVWHFWVSWINVLGQETFIESEPATLYTNVDPFATANNPQTTAFGLNQIPDSMMYFYRDEIRRREQAVLENDGEWFKVFLRKWSGKPCPHQDERTSSDPDYDSAGFCKLCFGTGILGGFWPGFDIKMRYKDLPERHIILTEQGIDFSHDFESWTLWLPKLHEHDLVVRQINGERFIIQNIAESSWRGQPLRQKLRLICLQPGDIRQLVEDNTIEDAMTHQNDPYEKPSIWG